METREVTEHIEHAVNKKIALLIAVLALMLAFVETFGKAFQTDALSLQLQSTNTWAFYQAKSIEAHDTELAKGIVIEVADRQRLNESEALKKWEEDIERLTSNEEDNDGKHQLMEKARELEAERDLMFKKYHYMEIAAGLLQVAIVLASASIITGAAFLVMGANLLGVVGVVAGLLGLLAPNLIAF